MQLTEVQTRMVLALHRERAEAIKAVQQVDAAIQELGCMLAGPDHQEGTTYSFQQQDNTLVLLPHPPES